MEEPEDPPEEPQALDWFLFENLVLGDEAEFHIKYTDQEGFTISAKDRNTMGGKLHQLRLTQKEYTRVFLQQKKFFLQSPPSGTNVELPSVYYGFVVSNSFPRTPTKQKVEKVVKVYDGGEIEFTVPSGFDLYLAKMNQGSNTDAIFTLGSLLAGTAGNNQFRKQYRRVSITELLSNLEAK